MIRFGQQRMLALVGILVVAACSSGGPSATSEPPASGVAPTPAGTRPAPAATTSPTDITVSWFDPLEQDGDEIEEPLPIGSSVPGPDGVALNAPGPAPEPDIEPPTAATVPDIDPCTLISADEFGAWTGEAAQSPTPLEGGDACGWMNLDDTLRVAVGVSTAPGSFQDGGFIPDRVDGEYLPDVGEWGATWQEGWPTAQSSTLVINAGPSGVLHAYLEVSARSGEHLARLRDTALHFAPIIAGRLA